MKREKRQEVLNFLLGKIKSISFEGDFWDEMSDSDKKIQLQNLKNIWVYNEKI